jgi:carbon monoxide dehydrogenase subunit G
MTRIESEKKTLAKPASGIYSYLSDFRNFSSIMPEQVTDWQATADTCSFTIKGMASLGMKITDRKPDESITIEKYGKAPFDFKLHCLIESINHNSSALRLVFEVDLNPMLKPMVEKPLKNFLDMMVDRYSEMA